jgi:hypothetical protein
MATLMHTGDDAETRLSRILEGAFKGAPTPLKDVPKADGGSRSPRENSPEEAVGKPNAKASRRGRKEN